MNDNSSKPRQNVFLFDAPFDIFCLVCALLCEAKHFQQAPLRWFAFVVFLSKNPVF